MPLRFLSLSPEIFRISTDVIYPPFKNGRYMEEYAYDYFQSVRDVIDTDLVYIPAFWTNLQIARNFQPMRAL